MFVKELDFDVLGSFNRQFNDMTYIVQTSQVRGTAYRLFLLCFSYFSCFCYDIEQLSDNCLYLCLVLGKLSIVYSHLLGSRFNLSSPRMPLVSGIVLEV